MNVDDQRPAFIFPPTIHQLVGDVRGKRESDLSFLHALATLMREHGVTKVDVAWDVIPLEAVIPTLPT